MLRQWASVGFLNTPSCCQLRVGGVIQASQAASAFEQALSGTSLAGLGELGAKVLGLGGGRDDDFKSFEV